MGYNTIVLQKSDHLLPNGNFNNRLQYYEVSDLRLFDINTLPDSARLTFKCNIRLTVNLWPDTVCDIFVDTNVYNRNINGKY